MYIFSMPEHLDSRRTRSLQFFHHATLPQLQTLSLPALFHPLSPQPHGVPSHSLSVHLLQHLRLECDLTILAEQRLRLRSVAVSPGPGDPENPQRGGQESWRLFILYRQPQSSGWPRIRTILMLMTTKEGTSESNHRNSLRQKNDAHDNMQIHIFFSCCCSSFFFKF